MNFESYQHSNQCPGMEEYRCNLNNYSQHVHNSFCYPQPELHAAWSQQSQDVAALQGYGDTCLTYLCANEGYYSHSSWSFNFPPPEPRGNFPNWYHPYHGESIEYEPTQDLSKLEMPENAHEHNFAVEVPDSPTYSVPKDEVFPNHFEHQVEQRTDCTGRNLYEIYY